MNAIVISRDFSQNVERFGSKLLTMTQTRNPKQFSLENFLVFIPKNDRDSVDDPVAFSVHCFHTLGDAGSHDSYTAATNLRQVLTELERKKLWVRPRDGGVRRIFLQSDGCPKEYKNVNSMVLLKKMAQDFNVAIQCDFFASGNGKGLVDAMGGVFRRQYNNVIIQVLQTDARNLVKVARWINNVWHAFAESKKESRLRVTIYR